LKLVLDTNTVVSGLFWRKAPRLILDAASEGQVELATSTVLIDELSEVIARAKFARKLTEQNVTARVLLRRYATLARRVTPASIRRTVAKDADDDALLACALAAQADLIVSGDSHLLNLKSYQRIPILTATAALAIITSA
jgi:uncharacterized protein